MALLPAITLFSGFFFFHFRFRFRSVQHFALGGYFYLFLLGIFLVYIPIADVLLQVESSFGYRLSFSGEINQRMAMVYSAAISAFCLGYLAASFLPGSLPKSDRVKLADRRGNRILYAFQLLVWLIYFLHLELSGISVFGLFNLLNSAEENILFSAQYRFPILELLASSIPVALFIQLRLGESKQFLWWFFFAFWLFMSLLGGWRFRIILFVLFFLFHLLEKKEYRKLILIWSIPLMISMAWLTLNRMAIAKRQFSLITFDFRLFDLGTFNNEFANSRTFRACLSQPGWNRFPGFAGWMKNPETMKPRLLEFSKSWIPTGWPWNPNPALSQPEEFFLLFGYSGLFFAMLLMGLYVFLIDHSGNGAFSGSLRIVLSGLLFQWFSRGYFPFQLKITFICLLPFLLLWMTDSYLSFQRHANKT